MSENDDAKVNEKYIQILRCDRLIVESTVNCSDFFFLLIFVSLYLSIRSIFFQLNYQKLYMYMLQNDS